MPLVHAVEVTRKNGGFIPASSRAEFHHHGAVIYLVFGQQQDASFLQSCFKLGLDFRQFDFGQFFEISVVSCRPFFGLIAVGAPGGKLLKVVDNGPKAFVLPHQIPVLALVRDYLRVSDLFFDFLKTVRDGGQLLHQGVLCFHLAS